MTQWTVACWVPLSMELFRQEYWRELPFPSLRDLPDPGMELLSPALAGRFFTTEPPGKPQYGMLILTSAFWQTPWAMPTVAHRCAPSVPLLGSFEVECELPVINQMSSPIRPLGPSCPRVCYVPRLSPFPSRLSVYFGTMKWHLSHALPTFP